MTLRRRRLPRAGHARSPRLLTAEISGKTSRKPRQGQGAQHKPGCHIRQALGNVKADTIILQGSFDFPGTTMPDLANRTVAAARQLYGTAAANTVSQAFADRGIL